MEAETKSRKDGQLIDSGVPSMSDQQTGPRVRFPGGLAVTAAALAATVGACSFEVVNPGPVEDDFLDGTDAHAAVVEGARRALSEGLNTVATTTSAVSREMFPSGSTGSFGISNFQQEGIIFWDDTHVSWTDQQQARFLAEDAVRRFAESEEVEDPGAYALSAEAALLAGYANRLLGENFCEAVIDGSEAQPNTVFLTRAEEWFTEAITVGTAAGEQDIVDAATAGRASVRVDLGNWAGAVADAQAVPDGFLYNAPYFPLEQVQFNRIFWAGAGQPYLSVSVWNTQWEDYYVATGDPRVPWQWEDLETGDVFDAFEDGPPADDLDATKGDAAVAIVEDSIPNGSVPFFQQMKHASEGAPIALSSKWEMNLIEAEASLLDGQVGPAVDLMNERRTDLGLPDLAPATLEEAWTDLKRERGAELWLQARRMNDIRRWQENSTPGALSFHEDRDDPRSFLRDASRPGEAELCYPIPRNERESNPNLPLQPS